MGWDDDWREDKRQREEEDFDQWRAKEDAERDACAGQYQPPWYSPTAYDAYEPAWEEANRLNNQSRDESNKIVYPYDDSAWGKKDNDIYTSGDDSIGSSYNSPSYDPGQQHQQNEWSNLVGWLVVGGIFGIICYAVWDNIPFLHNPSPIMLYVSISWLIIACTIPLAAKLLSKLPKIIAKPKEETTTETKDAYQETDDEVTSNETSSAAWEGSWERQAKVMSYEAAWEGSWRRQAEEIPITFRAGLTENTAGEASADGRQQIDALKVEVERQEAIKISKHTIEPKISVVKKIVNTPPGLPQPFTIPWLILLSKPFRSKSNL